MPTPVCFWDDLPGTVLVNGVYLCESHATCSACLKPVAIGALTCHCDKDGYAGHEEMLWCSERCLDEAHPDDEARLSEMDTEEDAP